MAISTPTTADEVAKLLQAYLQDCINTFMRARYPNMRYPVKLESVHLVQRDYGAFMGMTAQVGFREFPQPKPKRRRGKLGGLTSSPLLPTK